MVGDAVSHHALRLEVRKSELAQVLHALGALSWIRSVEVDSAVYRQEGTSPPAPYVGATARRFSQDVPWGVGISRARIVDSALGDEGGSVRVAIIDAGVDCDNDDLSARVYGGYDFVDELSTGCAVTNYHGTAVAGIVAATDDDGGVVGMAPTVHLYSYVAVNDSGFVESSAVLADAIDSARSDGARIINLSLGNCGADAPSIVSAAVADAIADSILVIAAAGNGAWSYGCSDSDPVSGIARLSGVIAVSEFDSTLSHTTHGQYGTAIALSGPAFVETDAVGPGYSTLTGFGGTSAATPHVSGAFALALAAGLTRTTAVSRLETYTRLAPGQSGKDNYNGYGQIDAAATIPTPALDSDTWCTNGNVTADSQLTSGKCAFVAHTHYGAPPVQAKFVVVTSVLHDTTVYDWGSLTRDIYIPPTIGGAPADTAGYTMTVLTSVRDSPFLRAAVDTLSTSFYVCNIGEAEYLKLPPDGHPQATRRGGNPDLPAGCTPLDGSVAHLPSAHGAPVGIAPHSQVEMERARSRTSGADAVRP